jgi:6-phosphogluconolactonase
MLLRLAFFFLLAVCARGADEVFYLGTYTNGTNSQGIYSGTLDTVTGKLGPLKLAAAAKQDPTFLTLSPDGKILFAALNDQVASYRVAADGTLREISRQLSGGPNTCGLCVNKTGRVLYAASYDAGTIAYFPVTEDGRIGHYSVALIMKGSGPNKDRQQSAHPHCVNIDPENHFLYACDLGADRIWIFRLNDKGAFSMADRDPAAMVCALGSGPRHLTFSADGKLVYVVNELNVSTSVFVRNDETGELHLLKTYPNVSETWPQGTGSAEVAVDPSKKWLLVSTRLQDFMTVFRVNPIVPYEPPFYRRQVFPSPVKFPRSFAIDPTDQWVVVAGETENRISVMQFDPVSGMLTATDQFKNVDRPVCVLFGR